MHLKTSFWVCILLLSVSGLMGGGAVAQEKGAFSTFAPLIANQPVTPISQFDALLVSNMTGDTSIYRATSDGQSTVALTDNQNYEIEPILAPDGSAILYKSHVGNDYNLYLMNPDGSNQRLLTNVEGAEVNYAWSPTSQEILFHVSKTLYVVSAAGGDALPLLNSVVGASQWSPDGSHIVTETETQTGEEGNINVRYLSRDGSVIRFITTATTDDTFGGWLNGGAQMIVSRTDGTDSDIYIYNSDGSGSPTELVVTDDDTTAVSVSPGGTYLVYSIIVEVGSRYRRDFGVLDLESGTTIITTGLESSYFQSVAEIAWSPDETTFTYTYATIQPHQTVRYDIYRVDFLEPNPHSALWIGNAADFSWSPNRYYGIYQRELSQPDGSNRTYYPVIRNLIDGSEVALGSPAYQTSFHGWLPLP